MSIFTFCGKLEPLTKSSPSPRSAWKTVGDLYWQLTAAPEPTGIAKHLEPTNPNDVAPSSWMIRRPPEMLKEMALFSGPPMKW